MAFANSLELLSVSETINEKLLPASLDSLIRKFNGAARPNGLKDFALQTQYDNVIGGAKGITLSGLIVNSPLVDLQSGLVASTIDNYHIVFDSTEFVSMTIIVDPLNDDEKEGISDEEAANLLKDKATDLIIPEYQSNDQLVPYTIGCHIESGSVAFHYEKDGKEVASRKLVKKGFTFKFLELDSSKINTEILGNDPKTATRVKVTLPLKGQWIGDSGSEKFAAAMAKYCMSPMVIPETLADCRFGGIMTFDGQHSFEDILQGKCDRLPYAMFYSGPETTKGGASFEEAAEVVEHVAKKQVLKTSEAVEGFDLGQVTEGSDEFIQVRNDYMKAT
ncbi:MAG: hypothetical protein L7S42_07925, partial [Flavobacteriaceae bacterium]|nr:hypothetical protein [Flavobacteriaceae bacterium]